MITSEKRKKLLRKGLSQRELYEDLADDIYRILVAMGVSVTTAASASHKLRSRGRMKPSEKGVDDGQYYREQPIAQPRRPSGAHYQPQNRFDASSTRTWQEPSEDVLPSQLGSDHRIMDRPEYRQDQNQCPICARDTLAVLNSLEGAQGVMEEDIRCTNCGARFKKSDLDERPLMEAASHTLHDHNHSDPISFPNPFLPKGLKKSLPDEELDLNGYVGFDVTKAVPHAKSYIDSPAYRKLLQEYFSELEPRERERLKNILKNAIQSGASVKRVARQIEPLFEDHARANLIARTELVRVSNEGNLIRMQQKGTEKVQYFAAPEDGRRCEDCGKRNGQIYTIKQAKGLIPIHQMCRCTLSEYYEP